MRILVVEDDAKIAANIQTLLQHEGYNVDITHSADAAVSQILSGDYDLVLLDWMLADGSGIAVCQEVRSEKSPIPILMLTARSLSEDIVNGLEQGADDYLTKPFRSAELLARCAALLRRKTLPLQPQIEQCGNIQLNLNTREVSVSTKKIALSPREFELLAYLFRNQDRVVDRLTLLAHVWGGSIDELSNTVDVHIRYLRKKLGTQAAKQIVTIKGAGYRLCAA